MNLKHRLAIAAALLFIGAAALTITGADRASACAMCDTYYVVNVEPGDVLYLRKTPSSSGKIVGAIPYDGIGIVKSGRCVGRWCKMSYNGKVGFVNMKFLKFNNP